MVCSMTRSKVKVKYTSPSKLEIWPFSKAIPSTIYNYGTISKFVQAGFLTFGLVFVSCDFEVSTNVSCEESTVSPRTALIFSKAKAWLGRTKKVFEVTCFVLVRMENSNSINYIKKWFSFG